MSLPSFRTLTGIALGVTVAGVSALKIMQTNKMTEIGTSPYFREAFKVLRAHPAAIDLLGEPIKQAKFDLADDYNFCDGTKARFAVNVKGAKDKGMVYFWAKLEDDGQWTINRMELEVPKGRLLLQDGAVDPEESYVHDQSS